MSTPKPPNPSSYPNPGGSRSGRDRILEHARSMFLDRGYLDVSMREIAESAGVRKATIYYHFQDKEALFTAIMLSEIADARTRMTESIVGLSGLPERLEELAFTHFSQSRTNSWRLAQDFREHVPESRNDEVHDGLGSLYDIYRSVFEDGLSSGEIAGVDPKFVASSFFHTIISWTWDFPSGIGAREMSPRDLARTAVQMVLYGVAGPALRQENQT